MRLQSENEKGKATWVRDTVQIFQRENGSDGYYYKIFLQGALVTSQENTGRIFYFSKWWTCNLKWWTYGIRSVKSECKFIRLL